ncbi:MAG: hypothetical protein M1814_000310 [Vezdaea aestivalis]|nr:MAG: hypothetical protein M1814_000310 [Vezdaea aestivalis]
MAISVDNQHRLGHFGLDSGLPYSAGPHFTNPWSPSSAAAQQQQYMPPSSAHLDALAKQQVVQSSSVSMPYATVSASAPDMINAQRLSNASSYDTGYSSASSPSSAFSNPPASSAPFTTMGYTTAPNASLYTLAHNDSSERRLSQAGAPYQEVHRQRQNSMTELNKGFAVALHTRDNFGDATLDAGRGMVAMSQDTPRNLYESRIGRQATEYFPISHSAASSISSASYNPSYYASSVDSSATDYSSAAESVDSLPSRTLPRPNGLMNGNVPSGAQAMMGQFSSKISTSSQKKHKCKICDKRFTRPSSLQTHTYSHTGEKRTLYLHKSKCISY